MSVAFGSVTRKKNHNEKIQGEKEEHWKSIMKKRIKDNGERKEKWQTNNEGRKNVRYKERKKSIEREYNEKANER